MTCTPRFSLRLTVVNFKKYFSLLQLLISRDLKNKYRQSILGYAWCVLHPLLVMLVMTFVFSQMFRSSIPNFPVYLFCGRMVFSFITDTTRSMQRSILSNASLLKKTRIPIYIFPLSTLFSGLVNLGFQLMAFALVLLFTKTPLTLHAFALPVLLPQLMLFTGGVGLLLACLNVFLRDTDYLYAVIVTAWTYLTPIFYPFGALPEWLQGVIGAFNPAYCLIEQCRSLFLYHRWPQPIMILQGFAFGTVVCVLACLLYWRTKDQMILYL